MKYGARSNPDRHIVKRRGVYQYKRRVPAKVAALDPRSPHVRISLQTNDLAVARQRRDAYESADEAYWASLLVGADSEKAKAEYMAAVKRAEAIGFSYKSSEEISQLPVDEIVQRVLAAMDPKAPADVAAAVLGTVEAPKTKLSDAMKIYCGEIVADELMGKSAAQRKLWMNTKQRAVDHFIQLIGDKAMEDITRDDARAFYNHWRERILPGDPKQKRLSPNSANREIGNLRVLYEAYFEYMGDPDRENPFRGLSFLDRKKRTRPPFKVSWLEQKFLQRGTIEKLNDEARGVVLALIETGARPSEICNLTSESIRIDDEIPHLRIEPRDDPDDPREIKTNTSVRQVPLVGVALEVFRKHRGGFPRYKDRESSMSATINKFLRNNDLLPTADHSVYSLRHTFEDRMKEGGIDEELRRILMGHRLDRPRYGAGGSMEWRRDQLMKIALPFDPKIV